MNKYKAMRDVCGMTQEEAAKGAKVSRQTIIRLEEGGVRPHRNTISKLIQFYREASNGTI